jgi:hypothetical protein
MALAVVHFGHGIAANKGQGVDVAFGPTLALNPVHLEVQMHTMGCSRISDDPQDIPPFDAFSRVD